MIGSWYCDLKSCSVRFSCSVMSNSLQLHELQNARLPCPSPTPRACSNSCPSSWWCHPTFLPSDVPFSSCLQTFPASGSFQMSQFFTSGSQNIGVSASTSVLPVNPQDWLPLGWTGWISLQSKGLSRVFSNTTVQKHQFFGAFHFIGEAISCFTGTRKIETAELGPEHVSDWLSHNHSSLLPCWNT